MKYLIAIPFFLVPIQAIAQAAGRGGGVNIFGPVSIFFTCLAFLGILGAYLLSITLRNLSPGKITLLIAGVIGGFLGGLVGDFVFQAVFQAPSIFELLSGVLSPRSSNMSHMNVGPIPILGFLTFFPFLGGYIVAAIFGLLKKANDS